MTDLTHIEVLDDEQPEFFAPVSSDMVDMLIGQYCSTRTRIEHVAAFVSEQMNSEVLHYFIEGNFDDDKGRMSLKNGAQQLFDLGGAVAALNASYWSKALQLTDVLDTMPQKRRNEWHEQIRNPQGKRHSRRQWGDQPPAEWEVEPLPDFTDETVRATLAGLLSMRAQFLGERVDGIFRGLSGEHVTNAPQGFGKRMILARALSSYGTSEHTTVGLINDLRAVVAKFMGRDEPKYNATDKLIDVLKRNWGEWMSVDGGAVRIRLYRKGTAHLEVHPDMAWRLNGILAHLYPLAIPAEFRERPKRRAKEHKMLGRPLPFAVLEVLGRMEHARDWYEQGYKKYARDIPMTRVFHYGADDDKNVRRQAEDVLRAIGGVEVAHGKAGTRWQFDYHPGTVIDQIVTSGCIPDQQSHQFYPTPERIARLVVEMAAIGPADTCLEPSAGLGGLADHMPKDRTTCVEIAPLHCRVLESKGYTVHEGDFVAWADTTVPRPQFDRVVLNPPFADGRAKLHTERAYSLLKPGGVLVAVLPASMRGKNFLPGATDWSGVFSNEFSGTSVSVVLMKVTRPL